MMKLKNKSIIVLFLSAITCFCLGLAFAFGGATGVKAEGENLYLTGARISLNENIVAKFPITNVPEGYTSATINYTFGTKTYEDTLAVEGGAVEFAFDKITPQTMNREVVATLTLTGEGVDAITETMSGFSVVNYAKKVFASNPEDLGCQTQEQYDALRTMVADLVNYGAKAQEYRGFNTANLATDALGVAQKNDISEFVAPTETDTSITGTESDKVAFRSATLSFGDTVDLAFKVYADDAKLGNQALTLKVKKEDGEWEDTVQVEKILHEDSDSVYVYTFEYQGLSVTEFNDVLTVQAYLNGTAEGKTLTYSVKSYVYSKVNDPESDPAMVELAKAIYNYGNAAQNYVDEVVNYTSVEKVFGWASPISGKGYNSNMTSDDQYLYVLATTGAIPASANQTDGYGVGKFSRQAAIVKMDPNTGKVLGSSADFYAQGGSSSGGGTEAYTVILHKDGYIYVIDAQNQWKKVACDALTTSNVALSDIDENDGAFFTKSEPVATTDGDTTTYSAELKLNGINGASYSAERKQFAVKSGTTINIYDEDANLVTSFPIVSSQNGASHNKISVNDDLIFINYKADTVLTPIVNAYTWDGKPVKTIKSGTVGLSAMCETTNVNSQGFAVCDGAIYSSLIRWSVSNTTLIVKLPDNISYEDTSWYERVLVEGKQYTTTDRTIRGWETIKGMATNMTTDGEFIYRIKKTTEDSVAVGYIQKMRDWAGNAWISTSAPYPMTYATSDWEDTPVFCYNGYIYVVQTGGILSKTPLATFAEGAAITACEEGELTFYNAEGTALGWSAISSVQYDAKADRFAVVYNKVVYICEANGTFVTSFTPANIASLDTYTGGMATGSMMRIAGEDGKLYIQMTANAISTIGYHVYDYEGNHLGIIKAPTTAHAINHSSAKAVGFAVIGSRIYYNHIRWTGGNADFLGVIEANSNVKVGPTISLGEYAETKKNDGTAWDVTITNPYGDGVQVAGGAVGGHGHGFATDGKYFYFTNVTSPSSGVFNTAIYKVSIKTNAVVATVAVDANETNSYTYKGRLAVIDGYVYMNDGVKLYRVACDKFDVVEEVTDFKAFDPNGVVTFGYSAENDAYVYVKSGKAYLVKADGTAIASGIAVGGEIAGCYTDKDYAYVVYEVTGIGMAAHIMDWQGNVVYSGTLITGISTGLNYNVQGLAVANGEIYIFCIRWKTAPTGGFVYKIQLNF